MEHYSEFKGRPAFLRSHLMATAIAHDDVTGKSNDFGLGRVSGYLLRTRVVGEWGRSHRQHVVPGPAPHG
jgi:hypothetical protein